MAGPAAGRCVPAIGMRLDRLELSGFKSFPDRSDVAFDTGVTAIVGPNGCGKSNLVDAITWVLGEQSARSLRGERMEDVIFSGSDARKATAAAEVRLRLSGVPTEFARLAADRREGLAGETPPAAADEPIVRPTQVDLPSVETREVEISRRLYRSGESEYLIDGEVCRLRDVQDLLMDAGVGVKAYAVIEQGKIGQILSSKPTERRQLIEEAAGITKYKSRRRAAELKLEAAQQNLTRIDDIVFEIEKQRAALKRQAARARRYRRLREDLRRWEKVLFARRYRALAQQIDAALARLAEARGREGDAVARVAAAEREVDETRGALARADERLRDLREQMHARELDNERREQQLAFNRQQVEALSQTARDLAEELRGLDGRREPMRAELDERKAAAVRAEDERHLAAALLADVNETAHLAGQALDACEGEVEQARAALFANQNALTTLQYAIERGRESRDRLSETRVRLEAEAADLRIELERLQAEARVTEDRLRGAREAIASSEHARAGFESSLIAVREARQARTEELRAGERELAALSARLRSLEELDAHREGYGDAARLVLAEPDSGVVHHGSVADYLDASPEHERALEALLGDILQCVVVSRPEDAQAGLAFVRERNAGRVGFLVAQGERPEFDGSVPPPDVTPVTAVVEVSGPHRAAILDALRGLWVAEHAELARRASELVPDPIATLSGDVYRAGRLVFGGTRDEARGILATRRQIKELRERQQHEQAHVQALAVAVATLETSAATTDAQLVSATADLHGHEKTAMTLELQVERMSAESDRLRRKQEQIAHEQRQIDEERQGVEARDAEAHEQQARGEGERERLQQAFAEAQRRQQEARDHAAAASHRVSEANAAHAALVERSAAVLAEVHRLEEAARDLEQRFEHRSEERRRCEVQRGQLDLTIADGERRQVVDEAALAALRDEVRQADELSLASQHRAEGAESGARDARVLLGEVRAEVARLEVARATSEADLNHLAAACAETLQASLDDVAAEVEAFEAAGAAQPAVLQSYAEEDAESDETSQPAEGLPPSAEGEPARQDGARALTAEEAIAELRAKIDRLGPVNMMAIEQFDELEQRHGFLTGQRKDLVDAIAATGEAIKRIDRTTRERFKEAFAAINKYFEETFTTLFGGGRAGLVLLDENDLLESGIDIIAQPPGKRLQNVQLLSGGEKALTAMALMFGIFKYRPSPFCLLDEIDAPLDDANIGRFIEMLRGMQERTQFILVTHHRKTMEIADRLYGVTMEEPGVSKLISLKLN